ncbi:MAG: diaminopimelate decarboxylase [Clostridiales bacterium]|nr:diaminopimelate decarboxylase [Clostridiales bacterium]
MYKLNGIVTDEFDFFKGNDVYELTEKYGSPLYVYNEGIIRQRCRELKNLVSYPKFLAQYSAKANTSLAFLQVVKSEGLHVDAMSPGEIYAELEAGFKPEDIFMITNNVSEAEMQYAIDKGVLICVDSVEQLVQYGRLNPNSSVAIRFNGGIGAGHHEKVVTAGKKTKFGVNPEYIPQVKEILKQYGLKFAGVQQHIGSLFMEIDPYINGSQAILDIAKSFDDLDFVDFGGGFGIPYKKLSGQPRLNLKECGEKLDIVFDKFVKEYGKEITFRIEPGRYISAESSVLLTDVHCVKYNGPHKFAGTDVGFNVLVRPAMYDSHHDIEVYTKQERPVNEEEITIVGNICESGDIIAKDRLLPEIKAGDILGILDAGAYGHSMCSNYNNRLRPAEVFIREDGKAVLTRKRDTLEQLLENYIKLN